ncbi:hypothetical protein KP014_01280 [Paenibacillus sophorae]|uniref:Uncharacterized protein n=1 Tax=Paenibacillus sophorae TaxID=1333845 RepID=A0ABX8HDC1_9BACL|nr:hypothetical protein [Paenibacillus sophorae]QWU15944.1 hypothetical protein KP014_01280 [Paenibacillus sophorae]
MRPPPGRIAAVAALHSAADEASEPTGALSGEAFRNMVLPFPEGFFHRMEFIRERDKA